MRYAIILAAALTTACSGSSPTAPTPPPVVVTPPVVTPPMVTPPAPNALLSDPRFDLSYYRDFAQGAHEQGTVYPLSRLTTAPRIFLNTADEAGRPIDAVTLDAVAVAMINVASTWSGGAFGLAGIERGTGTREGERGWLTVKWASTPNSMCGTSNHGQDGGLITFYYRNNCGCAGSAIKPVIAKHELGHAFGFWHTQQRDDVMTSGGLTACDLQPSERERFHAQVAYTQAIGTVDPR